MKEYDTLEEHLRAFVLSKYFFYVGTAPLSCDGHVNVSPKGHKGTFAFVSEDSVRAATNGAFPRGPQTKCLFAYFDIGGSGIETVAHLQENGRITICFVSHDDTPKIVRFFGQGRVLEPGQKGWSEIAAQFDQEAAKTFDAIPSNGELSKLRNIIIVDVDRIRDSCGFGVPVMKYEHDRTIFPERFATWERSAIEERRKINNNHASMDGLPGLPRLVAETESAVNNTAPCSKNASACPIHVLAGQLSSHASAMGAVALAFAAGVVIGYKYSKQG